MTANHTVRCISCCPAELVVWISPVAYLEREKRVGYRVWERKSPDAEAFLLTDAEILMFWKKNYTCGKTAKIPSSVISVG